MGVNDNTHQESTSAYRIDTNSDRLLQLARLADWLATRTGRQLHRSVPYSWRRNGIAGIRLPTVRLGGAHYTSQEAFSWWTTQLSQQGDL